jgi:hypothetical protein
MIQIDQNETRSKNSASDGPLSQPLVNEACRMDTAKTGSCNRRDTCRAWHQDQVEFVASKRYEEAGLKWASRESLPTERALLQQEKDARRNKALTVNRNKRNDRFPAETRHARDKQFERVFAAPGLEQHRRWKRTGYRYRGIAHTKVSGSGHAAWRHEI